MTRRLAAKLCWLMMVSHGVRAARKVTGRADGCAVTASLPEGAAADERYCSGVRQRRVDSSRIRGQLTDHARTLARITTGQNTWIWASQEKPRWSARRARDWGAAAPRRWRPK